MQEQNVFPFTNILLAHAPGPLGDVQDAPPDLEEQIGHLLARCQAAWPQLVLPAPVFVRYLAERLQGPALGAALATVHAEDLYLCCACVEGVPGALAVFDERILSRVSTSLASQGPAQIDEVLQQLRERLFVGTAETPAKIANYTGRGALGSWVRIAATRTNLNLRRNMDDKLAQREQGDPGEVMSLMPDPELEYLKRRYQLEFKAAIEQAMSSLPAALRTFLHLHYVRGLTNDQLGGLFRVSRATAQRRVAEAREKVHEETRRLLQERLGISPAEFQSLTRLVQSQLNASIVRCLAKDEKPPS